MGPFSSSSSGLSQINAHEEKELSLSFSSYKAANPLMVVSPSMNHSNPDYPPKVPSLNTVILGVRASTYEL